MKRLLLTSAAAVALVAYGTGVQAADMAVKAPPVPYIPPQFNWTGFYVGGNVGVGAVTGTVDDAVSVATARKAAAVRVSTPSLSNTCSRCF